jgi:hypothetical protein
MTGKNRHRRHNLTEWGRGWLGYARVAAAVMVSASDRKFPTMPHGEVSEIVLAASSEVFDLLHNYERRLEWDSLLSAAQLTDGWQRAEKGATSLCVGRRSLGKIALQTIYVTFDRPRLAAVKMVNQPPFFATWAAAIRHEDIGPASSRVIYAWNFTGHPRWLAWLLGLFMTPPLLHARHDRLIRSGNARKSTPAAKCNRGVKGHTRTRLR